MRIAEILFWAASKQPLPSRGVSGGEWMLVMLLCFFGATLHAVRGFPGWFPGTIELGGLDVFGESYDYPISGEKPSSKTPHVVIESFRGNARITGTDASQREGDRAQDHPQHGPGRRGPGRPRDAAGADRRSGTIIIRTNQNRASGLPRVTADMEIAVPKGASIEAHGRNGDFDIHDIDGAVEITSQSAGVRLEDIGRRGAPGSDAQPDGAGGEPQRDRWT